MGLLALNRMWDWLFEVGPDQHLTNEQRCRIYRDDELKAAYRQLRLELGREPSPAEIWAATPPAFDGPHEK